MSKLCIAIFRDSAGGNTLRNKINVLINDYKLGVFYDLSYTEPFLEEICGNSIICSLSDNLFSDNCEMLLLPDACSFNGKSNVLPFIERMKQIEAILKVILDHADSVDLFIADSGTLMDEFENYTVRIHEFLKKTDSLNSINPPDLHFKITR